MSLKLAWVNSSPNDPDLEPLWALVHHQVQEQAGNRARVELLHLDRGFGGVRSLPNRLMTDASMLSLALQNADRFDALCLGCWAVPTAAVRAAVAVPVTGLPEAAAHLVATIARAAAVVTVAPSLVPIFQRDLDLLGRHGFLASGAMTSWEPETSAADLLHAIDDPSTLIDRFETAASRAVDLGADAVIVGCAYVSAIFAAHGYRRLLRRDRIAVLDCNAMAIEHILMLARLHASGVMPDVSPLTLRQQAGLKSAAALLAPTTTAKR